MLSRDISYIKYHYNCRFKDSIFFESRTLSNFTNSSPNEHWIRRIRTYSNPNPIEPKRIRDQILGSDSDLVHPYLRQAYNKYLPSSKSIHCRMTFGYRIISLNHSPDILCYKTDSKRIYARVEPNSLL